MNLKKLSLEDKDILNSFLLDCNIECGERNFTNIYMWRDVYNMHYAIIDGTLYLVSLGDTPFAFFP